MLGLLLLPAKQHKLSTVKRLDDVGVAAQQKVAVGHDLLTCSLSASVPEIDLERRPRGDPPHRA